MRACVCVRSCVCACAFACVRLCMCLSPLLAGVWSSVHQVIKGWDLGIVGGEGIPAMRVGEYPAARLYRFEEPQNNAVVLYSKRLSLSRRILLERVLLACKSMGQAHLPCNTWPLSGPSICISCDAVLSPVHFPSALITFRHARLPAVPRYLDSPSAWLRSHLGLGQAPC